MRVCKIYYRYLLLIFLSILLQHGPQAQVLQKRSMTLMGSRFQVTIIGRDSLDAQQKIDAVRAEIVRIENLISEWNPATQISLVNKNAGIKPVKVDQEVLALTQRALYFSEQSAGAFDISIVAMDKIWQFDGRMDSMPTAASIQRSVAQVGYRDIEIDTTNSTIFLKRPGMEIGFGSIGKGYAADRARALMLAMGVQGGIVDASGDIASWGRQLSGKPWLIGIRNPFKLSKAAAVLRFENGAVVTSGSYEKYAEIDGKRFSHIINPKTGYPATGLISVTICGPSAEFANGLSTSIMVLGVKEGKKMLKKFPQYSGLFITDSGNVITVGVLPK